MTTTPADGEGTALEDDADPDKEATLPEVEIGTGDAGVDVTDQADLAGRRHAHLERDSSRLPVRADRFPERATRVALEIGDEEGIKVDRSRHAGHLRHRRESHVRRSVLLARVAGFEETEISTTSPRHPSEGECFEVNPVTPTLTTTAVQEGRFGRVSDHHRRAHRT